jgi:hypothetical protein
MKRKSELNLLAEAVRLAERQFDAAATLSDLRKAAGTLQRGKADLKRAQGASPPRYSPRGDPCGSKAGAL